MPFISEKIYQVLKNDNEVESVHLCDYPLSDDSIRDYELEDEMELVEKVVSLGRSIRYTNRIKVRQPLLDLVIITTDKKKEDYLKKNSDIIKDELNIKQICFSNDENKYVSISCKANFKVLGKRLGKDMKKVASLISQFSAEDINKLKDSSKYELDLGDKKTEISLDDVILDRSEKEGHAVLNHEDVTVALNLTINDQLELEGISRDFINKIQKERKNIGLEYTDKININVICDELIKKAVDTHIDYIKHETLALDVIFDKSSDNNWITDQINEKSLKYKLKKV
jgi:isoleucyl-tRNA synthetase